MIVQSKHTFFFFFIYTIFITSSIKSYDLSISGWQYGFLKSSTRLYGPCAIAEFNGIFSTGFIFIKNIQIKMATANVTFVFLFCFMRSMNYNNKLEGDDHKKMLLSAFQIHSNYAYCDTYEYLSSFQPHRLQDVIRT